MDDEHNVFRCWQCWVIYATSILVILFWLVNVVHKQLPCGWGPCG